MNEYLALLLSWFGFNEPKTVIQQRRIDAAVQQRKAACVRLDRAIKDVALSAQKK